jgi:multidrug efflux pump subunit AcrA (membrane-fusion protein)
VDERTRAFTSVVEVKGRPGLVGGLFARAEVAVGTAKGALVVPPAALVRDGTDPGRAEVFVVRQGKAEKQEVELGVETPDGVQATGGLAAGDVVVLDPPTALSSGAPVEPQNGRSASGPPAAK